MVVLFRMESSRLCPSFCSNCRMLPPPSVIKMFGGFSPQGFVFILKFSFWFDLSRACWLCLRFSNIAGVFAIFSGFICCCSSEVTEMQPVEAALSLGRLGNLLLTVWIQTYSRQIRFDSGTKKTLLWFSTTFCLPSSFVCFLLHFSLWIV